MNRERYIRLMDWGTEKGRRTFLIVHVNKFVTAIVYIAYPVLLYELIKNGSEMTYKVLLVPAVSLFLVSVFRYLYNEERPYIVYEIDPIMQKKEPGKSMPSRHVFSAFIIAMAFLYVQPILSIPVFICAIVMGIGRILAGIHYPKDVIVGAILGIGMGALGFFILPI